jgi:hypothetical protein
MYLPDQDARHQIAADKIERLADDYARLTHDRHASGTCDHCDTRRGRWPHRHGVWRTDRSLKPRRLSARQNLPGTEPAPRRGGLAGKARRGHPSIVGGREALTGLNVGTNQQSVC